MRAVPNSTDTSILLSTLGGKASAHSPEELLARGLNRWKGWICGAGLDNVHITPDGNIFTATCKVGGLLGNIYDTGVLFPEVGIECTRESCICGSDMRIRKARSYSIFDQIDELRGSSLSISEEETVNPDWVSNYYLYQLKDFPKTITWDLGRRCNYSCSYCPPSTSNHFEAHKSWGSLQQGFQLLHNGFCRGKKAKWVFTGGEPTLNPAYLDLVKLIFSQGHLVHTQSNGSRNAEYFSELIQFSNIGLSLHFEGYSPERFIENCAAIIEQIAFHPRARKHWFGVRVMVPPGKVEQALEVKAQLNRISGFSKFGKIAFSPIYEPENNEKLLQYHEHEILSIQANA